VTIKVSQGRRYLIGHTYHFLLMVFS